MSRKEKYLQPALEAIMELAENEILTPELAMEAIAFLTSFFNSSLDHTVRVEKEGERSLFYSTLAEDEAHFWDWPLSCIQGLQQPGSIGCRRVELPLVGGFYGVWILEDKKRDIPELTKEESGLIQLGYLFAVICLFSEETKRNLETDPVTGLPSINAFVREMDKQMGEEQENFLTAIRIPVIPESLASCGEKMDVEIGNLSEICQKICPDRVYRIAADILAFTTKGSRELAYGKIQEILECVPEAVVFLIPIPYLKKGKILSRIQKELAKTEKGKATVEDALIFPRLPFFTEPGDKE